MPARRNVVGAGQRRSGPVDRVRARPTDPGSRAGRCAARGPARPAWAPRAGAARRSAARRPGPAAGTAPGRAAPAPGRVRARRRPDPGHRVRPAGRGRRGPPSFTKASCSWESASRIGAGLRPGGLLDQRQQRADGVDRQPDLADVALVLGARRQAGPPHPQVDQRDDLLEHDVLDPDLLDLGLVGGAQLLLRGLAARRLRDRLPPVQCSSAVTSAEFPGLQNRCRASRPAPRA